MKSNLSPLTDEMRDFAEAHYSVLTKYLWFHHLDPGEYHGWAALGYLKAVQDYFLQERLRKYQFATIAKWDMFHAIYNYRKKEKRQFEACQKAMLYHDLLLNSEVDVLDFVMDQISYQDTVHQLSETLDKEQMDLLHLMAEGYSSYSAGRQKSVSPKETKAQLHEARGRVISILPALEEKWAA